MSGSAVSGYKGRGVVKLYSLDTKDHEPFWDNIQPEGDLPADADKTSWKAIRRQTGLARRQVLRIVGKSMAAAAMVAGITVAVLQYGLNRKQAIAEADASTSQTTTVVRRIRNDRQLALKCLLPDSSVVVLSPGSEIRYDNRFGQQSRTSHITGRAFFQVKKDPRTPFTIYAGDVATTALGTAFWVDAFPQQSKIKVQLVSGKVVVKTNTRSGHADIAPVFLMPGQQFSLSLTDDIVRVSNIKTNNATGTTVTPGQSSASSLAFDNQPLSSVLATLQQRFHVKVHADQRLLKNKFFSGAYDPAQDRIDNILGDIGSLNGFDVIRTDDGFRLLPRP